MTKFMNCNFLFEFKGLEKTVEQMDDVGFVSVQVHGARGLRSADFVTSSDPYATVELGNKFLRTHTCYNTLEPTWNRNFKL